MSAVLPDPAQETAPGVVRTFLDLSTGHLSLATRNWLDWRSREAVDDPFRAYGIAATGFGWFVYVGDETEIRVPGDLALCMRRARALNADYILFDADALIDDALPVFDDENPDNAAPDAPAA